MGSSIAFAADIYTARREVLKKKMGSGRILLMGNDEASMNYVDNTYHYRQDSSFLYYIGISQPGLNAVIDIDKNETILFGNDPTIETVIWTGKTPSISELGEQVGIHLVEPSSQLLNFVSEGIHYLPPYRDKHTLKLRAWTTSKTLKPSIQLIKAIIEQRSIKSAEEIELLDKASSISRAMHKAVSDNVKAGMTEYELISYASKVAWQNDCQFAYPAIMTKNGQTLHNHYYGNVLQNGDMVLYDGGAELPSGYCGDLTRTIPVSGTFTPLQQQIHDLVRSMYDGAVDMSKAGTRYYDVHMHTARIMTEGLIDIGWMKGNVDDAIAEGAFTVFFPHGLGHMLGLDVHDMENFGEEYVGYTESFKKSTNFGLRSLRLGKELEEGYVITIEPGIYVIPELIEQRQRQGVFMDFINYDALKDNLGFGGIRLEDDYLVLSDGVRILGSDQI